MALPRAAAFPLTILIFPKYRDAIVTELVADVKQRR
jgi:hypothetical protein